jgi:hypothetical protein
MHAEEARCAFADVATGVIEIVSGAEGAGIDAQVSEFAPFVFLDFFF